MVEVDSIAVFKLLDRHMRVQVILGYGSFEISLTCHYGWHEHRSPKCHSGAVLFYILGSMVGNASCKSLAFTTWGSTLLRMKVFLDPPPLLMLHVSGSTHWQHVKLNSSYTGGSAVRVRVGDE